MAAGGGRSSEELDKKWESGKRFTAQTVGHPTL
jgi:hypothetical protein